MSKPKILLWDLETSHNLGVFFDCRTEYINYENIIKDRVIICGSWKWYGKKQVYSKSIADNPKFAQDRRNDKEVLLALRDVIEDSDAIVAHNGDRFDFKFFNTRCLYHGIQPVSKKLTIDTLKVVKRHFNFNSNRLDYIGKFLGLGQKIKTNNAMWLCVSDEGVPIKQAEKLIKQMVKYNRRDVTLLEQVFDKLYPYIDKLPNHNLFNDTPITLCPACGSENHQRRGYTLNKTGKYQKYQCQDCSSWFQDTKRIDKSVVRL